MTLTYRGTKIALRDLAPSALRYMARVLRGIRSFTCTRTAGARFTGSKEVVCAARRSALLWRRVVCPFSRIILKPDSSMGFPSLKTPNGRRKGQKIPPINRSHSPVFWASSKLHLATRCVYGVGLIYELSQSYLHTHAFIWERYEPRLCLPSRSWFLFYQARRDGRLSRPSWLVTYLAGLPVRRRSPIQVLTGPSVD